jgi:RNA polymerase sigma factor (sigma-70 family)
VPIGLQQAGQQKAVTHFMPEAKTKEQQAQEFLEAAARNYSKHLEHLRIQKVKWRTGQACDADDVLQDAILKCHDKISRSGLSEGFYYFTYLNTAISNNFGRYYQKSKRNLDFSFDFQLECQDEQGQGGQLGRAMLALAEEKSDHEAEQVHLDAVTNAFEQLPEKYKELLRMDMSGLKYQEMCRVLGLKMGQVKMRIKTGRDLIKAQVGAYPKTVND